MLVETLLEFLNQVALVEETVRTILVEISRVLATAQPSFFVLFLHFVTFKVVASTLTIQLSVLLGCILLRMLVLGPTQAVIRSRTSHVHQLLKGSSHRRQLSVVDSIKSGFVFPTAASHPHSQSPRALRSLTIF